MHYHHVTMTKYHWTPTRFNHSRADATEFFNRLRAAGFFVHPWPWLQTRPLAVLSSWACLRYLWMLVNEIFTNCVNPATMCCTGMHVHSLLSCSNLRKRVENKRDGHTLSALVCCTTSHLNAQYRTVSGIMGLITSGWGVFNICPHSRHGPCSPSAEPSHPLTFTSKPVAKAK